MKVHLLRSDDYSLPEFWDVFNLISQFPGPIQFLTKEEPLTFQDDELTEDLVGDDKFFSQRLYCADMAIPKRLDIRKDIFKWENVFEKCKKYRIKHSIPAVDHVILLTTMRNNLNWFSALDPCRQKNAFVHTSYWDYYLRSPARYPTAYNVAANVLRMLMFDDITTLQSYMHKESLGCMNDFNKNKKEVIYKLRTADICGSCIQILMDKGIDRLIIKQVLNVFEGIRKQMLFNQGFQVLNEPSRLLITHDLKLFLPDFNNIEIRLKPLDKALYFFYLNHFEGVYLHDLIEHRDELKKLYKKVSTSATADQIENSITTLVNIRDESVNEKISRIKKAFTDILGKDMAGHYYIKGERGGVKTVGLDRDLIISHHLIKI